MARALIPLLDLTRLDDERDPDVASFAASGLTSHGPVAALVVWPEHVAAVRAFLPDASIRVATVAGFPTGPLDSDGVAKACAAAVEDGADEVDIVFAYTAWIAGDRDGPRQVVRAASQVLKAHTLKVIFETAAFMDAGVLRDAARSAIEDGADFLKTSTGKGPGGATPAAARVLVQAIADSGRGDVGFKASGGIRTLDDCRPYVEIVASLLGEDEVGPDRLRFGASGLLNDLLAYAGDPA